jgi:Flp pilus assembly protein TadD
MLKSEAVPWPGEIINYRRLLLVFILGLENTPAAWAAGSTSSSSTATAASAYKISEKAARAGDFSRAIPLLKQMAAKSPKNAATWNYLGFSHRKPG